LCGAHLLRELTYLSEASDEEKKWAEPLMKPLLEMKEVVDEARNSGMRQVSREQRRELIKRYDELTEENWRKHQQSEVRAGPDDEAETATKPLSAVFKQS